MKVRKIIGNIKKNIKKYGYNYSIYEDKININCEEYIEKKYNLLFILGSLWFNTVHISNKDKYEGTYSLEIQGIKYSISKDINKNIVYKILNEDIEI